MCCRCEGFRETVRIEHPYQYFNLVDQIRTVLQDGTLFFVEGNCKLEEIIKGKPFTEDVLYHVFQCTTCGCKFSLSIRLCENDDCFWEITKKSGWGADIGKKILILSDTGVKFWIWIVS